MRRFSTVALDMFLATARLHQRRVAIDLNSTEPCAVTVCVMGRPHAKC